MASNVCHCLIDKAWRFYANDLAEAPKVPGIYAIGVLKPAEKVMYVGQANNIRRRLKEHKYPKQKIGEFVKGQFDQDGGRNLVIKWVEEPNYKCQEKNYLNCMSNNLGYWPPYNLRHGISC